MSQQSINIGPFTVVELEGQTVPGALTRAIVRYEERFGISPRVILAPRRYRRIVAVAFPGMTVEEIVLPHGLEAPVPVCYLARRQEGAADAAA